MLKILLLFLVVCSSLISYGQKYQDNGTPVNFTNGLRVGKNFRLPQDTLATADTQSVAIVNGVIYYKYGNWHPIGFADGDSVIPTEILFSPSLVSTPRLVGLHPITEKPIYIDSAHLRNELDPWPMWKIYGRAGGPEQGLIDYNFQTVLDANAWFNKTNVINFGGFKLRCDSAGIIIWPKFGTDTALFVGGGNLLVRSNGYSSFHGDVLAITPAGVSIRGTGKYLAFGGGSSIYTDQQPLKFVRQWPGVPSTIDKTGFYWTNDNQKGTVYPYADSLEYRMGVFAWKNEAGVESEKFRFYANGEFYRAYLALLSSPTTSDVLIVRGPDGKDKGISISDLGDLLGAGGTITLDPVGSTPNADGASLSGSVLNLQPADATHPGVITAGAQTLGGAKIFSSNSTQFTPGTNGETTLRVNAAGGTPIFQVGTYPLNTAFAGFWAGNITPSSTNAFMQANNVATLFSASSILSFRVNSSDKMYMTSTGIGVNNTSPTVAFDVTGKAKISDTLTITTMGNADSTDRASSTAFAKRQKKILSDSLYALKTPATLTDGSTITQTSYNARVVSAGNRTWAISNPENGQTYTLIYVQDGSGGRTLTGPDASIIFLNKEAGDSTLVIAYRQNNGWFISSANLKTSGRYTPTITDVSNTSAITAYSFHWERKNNEVKITGVFTCTTTAASGTGAVVRVTLPPGLNTSTGFGDLTGNGTTHNLTPPYLAAYVGVGTSTQAEVYWEALSAGGNNTVRISFTYTTP